MNGHGKNRSTSGGAVRSLGAMFIAAGARTLAESALPSAVPAAFVAVPTAVADTVDPTVTDGLRR